MKKLGKIALVGGVVGILIFAWNGVQGLLGLDKTEETNTPPVTTTQPVSMLDSIDIIKKDISSLKTSDAEIKSKLSQITQLLQMIEAQLAALKK